MKGILIGFFGLVLYVVFIIAAFFDTTSGKNSGEVEPLKTVIKIDSINVDAGNFSEVNRPPVYVGIGPGGPPNHVIKLKTGIIRTRINGTLQ